MNRSLPGILFLFLWLISSCTPPPDGQTILFLGHPYQWAADGRRIDYRIEHTDRAVYDHIWLGGDVCAKLTERPETLTYLDSLLGLGSDRIHWSWGNHDIMYGGEDRIRDLTGRNDFYTIWQDGYQLLVLNTNLLISPEGTVADSLCRRAAAQSNLVQQLCDTIQAASHLIILHHHGLLTNELAADSVDLRSVFNLYRPDYRVACVSGSTFASDWYPQFAKAQKKGVQVVFVGGDMGMRAKQFAHRNPEGIWFLGAGINNTVPDFFRPEYITNFEPDQVIEFRYEGGALSWKFRELNAISRLEGPQR